MCELCIVLITICAKGCGWIHAWNHFPRYWPSVRGIHRSRWIPRTNGQWRGALMFSLICAWINDWVNSRGAGDLRRHNGHYDVSVMDYTCICQDPKYFSIVFCMVQMWFYGTLFILIICEDWQLIKLHGSLVIKNVWLSYEMKAIQLIEITDFKMCDSGWCIISVLFQLSGLSRKCTQRDSMRGVICIGHHGNRRWSQIHIQIQVYNAERPLTCGTASTYTNNYTWALLWHHMFACKQWNQNLNGNTNFKIRFLNVQYTPSGYWDQKYLKICLFSYHFYFSLLMV